MNLLLTRPKTSSEVAAKKLVGLGHVVTIEPMLNIVPLAKQRFDKNFSAVVFTSQNAVRVFCENNPNWLSDYTGEVFAVGPRTAQAVADNGFSRVVVGSGDVDSLALLVVASLGAPHDNILFPRGKHVKGDLQGILAKNGFRVEPAVLYEAQAVISFSAATLRALKAGQFDYILFYSARTAGTFINLAEKANIKLLAKTTALALSEDIAKVLQKLNWRSIVVACEKTEQALFECINNDKIN